MSRSALLACALLLAAGTAYAATPDELWQDYQKRPDIVSTTPVKPKPHELPPITVEPKESTPDAPANVKEQSEQAQTPNAAQTQKEAKNAQAQAPNPAPAQVKEQSKQAQAPNAAPEKAQAQAAPVVSSKPVADASKPKPKPKLSLVGKPPLPLQFMRTPQATDFEQVTSVSGGYSLALPRIFGANPLSGLPQTEGAMLVRTAGNMLMCAVTMLDAGDTVSFNAQQPLPKYENTKVYLHWQHGAALLWSCTLSRQNDYHGDKMLLEAEATQNGRTYQMLFVMPAQRYTDLLPQAVYALDSFKLN
ncbi:hypothetical protein [uncultured Phascolarctobacterium sp.]|jgi:hypothetical protein|uniref:hypothetical protein n=1 Tax=uncultured Phascolarctobacterium sp. TaxID=512296 RepID=UPI0025EAA82C|nr:hypothetical protein [uncultured Phascolarctobacterium sp.]